MVKPWKDTGKITNCNYFFSSKEKAKVLRSTLTAKPIKETLFPASKGLTYH